MTDSLKIPAPTRRFARVPFVCCLLLAGGTGARAARMNVFTPQMQQIRKDYTAETDKQATNRLEELTQLIGTNSARYDEMLENQKVSGNIKGMAVARTGIRVFKTFGEELGKDGDFKFPASVRRELVAHIDQVKTAKEEIETGHAAASKEIEEKYFGLFLERCRSQGADTSDPSKFRKLFRDLAGADAVAATPGTTESGSKTNVVPTVVGSSGDGSEWVPFARWYAEINGMEVFRIGVMDKKERKRVRGRTIFEREYETDYAPIRMLTPGDGFAFRIKRLPGKEAAEVMDWPRAGNGWKMTLRLRPAREVPSKHGLEFLVSFPGAGELPLVAGTLPEDEPATGAEPPPGPDVEIMIKTRPDGAHVYVDGKKVMGTNDSPRTTPCTVTMSQGKHEVRLAKLGFKDVVFKGFAASAGRAVAWPLRKDPRFKEKTFQVSAKGRWRSSGLRVSPGDIVVIEASGRWSCGSKGEMVGAKGYPNDRDYFAYYLDPRKHPRQVPKINYGALLMRVGPNGKVIGMKDRVAARVKTGGTLYFDINEAEGPARGDNKGAISLHIKSGPAGRSRQ